VIAASQALAEEFAVNKMKQWEASAAAASVAPSSRPWQQQQQQRSGNSSSSSRPGVSKQRALGAHATSLVAGVGSGSSGGAVAARVLDSHHDMLLAVGLHQSYSHPSEHHELAQAAGDKAQQQAAEDAVSGGFVDGLPHRIITMEGSHQALQGMRAMRGLDSCEDESAAAAAAADGGGSADATGSSSSRRGRRGGIVSMASLELSEEDWDEADLQVGGGARSFVSMAGGCVAGVPGSQ
jgi:hypothetical protein